MDDVNLPIRVAVKKLHPAAQMPRYAHAGPFGDLAADLYAVEPQVLAPGETAAVATGISLGLPAGYGALVEDRSGLAVAGITTLAGVIDPGYRGEIKVVLANLSQVPFHVEPGMRIAQLRLVRRIEPEFAWAEDLDETMRNAGGFGSTGR